MWVHTNVPTWELIGEDNGLTWVYTNTHTRELNRYRPDQTRPDRQTHFKSFQNRDRETAEVSANPSPQLPAFTMRGGAFHTKLSRK
jgi:hypothetical protein